MELVNRYLQAVGFWLPAKGKQDILAELSEDIHAELADREQAAGHPLTDTEISALLKARGRPIFVANAYQPPRYVIGPLLFPIYRFVLKIVTACYLLPSLLVSLALLSSPRWRASQHIASWPGAIASAFGHVWSAALFAVGTVTLLFAVLERSGVTSTFTTAWDPAKLPRIRTPDQLGRGSAVFELTMTILLLVWWLTKMGSLTLVNQPGVQIVVNPAWHTFFWAIAAVWLGGACLAVANALRPYWTLARATIRLLLDMTASGLFCWLAQANIVSRVTIASVAPERWIPLTRAVNLWAQRCLPLCILVGVILTVVDMIRIVRVLRAHGAPRHDIAVGQSGYQS